MDLLRLEYSDSFCTPMSGTQLAWLDQLRAGQESLYTKGIRPDLQVLIHAPLQKLDNVPWTKSQWLSSILEETM